MFVSCIVLYGNARNWYYYRRYSSEKWTSLTAMSKTAKLYYIDKTAKKGVKYQYAIVACNGNYRSTYYHSASIKR